MLDRIVIRGARQHNLKNIDLEVPRGLLTVITGVSGSGKSTLAFDTLYAEGQRRYIESLSTYAKQFLERIGRPDVDEVLGISPSIAIQQKNTTRSSRSTVGTATEIYDYLRLLFARVGRTFCPDCQDEVVRYEADEVADDMLCKHAGETFLIVATYPSKKDTTLKQHFEALVKDGYSRILVDGEIVKIDPPPKRKFGRIRDINIVLDRVRIESSRHNRLHEAVETAYRIGQGYVKFEPVGDGTSVLYTNHHVCTTCERTFEEPRPLLFSFNTPYGACPHCRGFGNRMEFDESLVVPDQTLSIRNHAVEPWSTEKFSYFYDQLIRFCRRNKIPIDEPYASLNSGSRLLIIEGDGDYVGVFPFLHNLREKTYKKYTRFFTRRYMTYRECGQCKGGRLRAEAYYVKLGGKEIREVAPMTPSEALDFTNGLKLTEKEKVIAKDVLVEIKSRLQFMLDVGLYYITLNRLTKTLSGGEAQRISLANSLGANLLDVLYVLDEPSIGLHPRDTASLVKVLEELRARGNTVVVVEHDLDIIKQADYIVDMGPGAGNRGGEVVYRGEIGGDDKGISATLRYVRDGLPVKKTDGGSARRRARANGAVVLHGVSEHNLKDIDVEFPLGVFNCVTGVSGSGKSTLVHDVLYHALRGRGGDGGFRAHAFRDIAGRDLVNKVMMVDQSPIGKTPRSNPITYIKAFATIRDVFASQRRAVNRGYKSGRFSFNVTGGRCARCQGMGYERVEMHFMADLFIRCSECDGKRYNHETLEVTYRGLNLAEVLELTVEDAIHHFADHKQLVERLRVLEKVGLGYLQLGQPSTTLSGG
jgi:excinuclease ABC subunit A